MKKFPKNECLGWRPVDKDGKAGPFKWITYEQTAAKVAQIASGLVKVGLQPKGRVGIFGANSPEWMTTMQVGGACKCGHDRQQTAHIGFRQNTHCMLFEHQQQDKAFSRWCNRHLQACNRQSLYCVPLYDSLGENAIEYIVEHSESTIVFASSDKLVKTARGSPHCAEHMHCSAAGRSCLACDVTLRTVNHCAGETRLSTASSDETREDSRVLGPWKQSCGGGEQHLQFSADTAMGQCDRALQHTKARRSQLAHSNCITQDSLLVTGDQGAGSPGLCLRGILGTGQRVSGSASATRA